MNRILVKAIDRFGRQHQTIRAMEELAELITALAKGDVKQILEETADVEIMLEQVKYMYGIDTEMKKAEKIQRLNDRMDTGYYGGG